MLISVSNQNVGTIMWGKNFNAKLSHFDTIADRERQTDSKHRAYAEHRARRD